MPRAKVQLNHSGMSDLLNDPGVTADLRRRGERVAATARSTAPVDTGAYRDGITVWEDETDRTVVRIGSTDWKSGVVEAQTGNLARALDAAGGA